MQERKEFIDQLLKQIYEIPISDIIGTRIDLFKGKDALCPFHNDTHIGSFKIDDKKNIFKCFSCGEGGNAVNFIQKFEGVSYTQAAFIIGLEFGLITQAQADQYTTIKRNKIENIKINKINKETNLVPITDSRKLNTVYYVLSKWRELAGQKDVLTKEHRDYLHERGFDDLQIRNLGCFSMPEKKDVALIKNALKRYSIYDLSGVPGFYYDNKYKKWLLNCMKGIGIPVRNTSNQITGIQIRMDNVKEGQRRYLWLTSVFVDDPKLNQNKRYDQGCAAQSNLSIIWPIKELRTDTIFITEGIFKASMASNYFGCICISFQGIGNIDGADNAINEIISKYKMTNKKVIIAYDGDMDKNENVFKHLKRLAHMIQDNTECKVEVLIWDENYGKGIDDVIVNKNVSKIRKKPYEWYEKRYEKILNDSMGDDGKIDKKILSENFKKNILG